MKAGLLIVGSELLTPYRSDTNSLYFSRILGDLGIPVVEKIIVGDDEEAIAEGLAGLARRADLLLISGGLGPTRDDVTREGAARFLNVPLVEDTECLPHLEAFYNARNLSAPPFLKRQCLFPEGSRIVPNSRGTAPGFHVEREDLSLWTFPGVPDELVAMAEKDLIPHLAKRGHGSLLRARLILSGLRESQCEEILAPYYERFGREGFTILSSPKGVEMILTHADSKELGLRRQLVEELFAENLVSSKGEPLECVIVHLLAQREETLSVAESCTGGMASARITGVPGASLVFMGGVVAYDNEVKNSILGIGKAVLNAKGAVSKEVALALAHEVRERLGTDYGIGITGIAGPGGGSPEKPVGTVHMALSWRDGEAHVRHLFPGGRERVRAFAVQFALDLLWRRLR